MQHQLIGGLVYLLFVTAYKIIILLNNLSEIDLLKLLHLVQLFSVLLEKLVDVLDIVLDRFFVLLDFLVSIDYWS